MRLGAGKVGPVQFGLALAGVGLVVSGVLNKSPVAILANIARGDTDAPAPPIYTTPAVGTGGVPIGGSPASSRPDGMVSWTNPNAGGDYAGKVMWMTPATRAGLVRWDALMRQAGFPGLVLTSAWRSYQDQANGYADDPGRYASPDKSWHVTGRAVDVHLEASGVTSAKLSTYIALGQQAGWCFAGRSGKMHASFGGCG